MSLNKIVVFVQFVKCKTSLSMSTMSSHDGNNDICSDFVALQFVLSIKQRPHGKSVINIVGLCAVTTDAVVVT